jgi:hypothetical protein
MAKLTEISLEELYARKVTSSVEAAILTKEDFSVQSKNWCDLVCKLKCKNPPLGHNIFNKDEVDVLIIQDYKAFDDPKFKKAGGRIEQKHLDIIDHFAGLALRRPDGSRMSIGITSLLKCQLQQVDISKGKAPTDTVIQKCKPYLLEEIRHRKPKVIITLSTSVTKGLGFAKKSNYNDRGEITQTADGVPVVITAHPRILVMLRQNSSGKMWGPDFYSVVLNDFVKAAKIVNGDLSVPNLDEAIERVKKQIRIARSIEEVAEFSLVIYKESAKNKIISFDTETSSLDPYLPTAKLITCQYGYRDDDGVLQALVIPLWHRNNIWFNAKEAWDILAPTLLDPSIMKIGHNIKFDIIYTFVTTGLRMQGVLFDTMLIIHAINSGLQGMYGLKKAVHDWLPEIGLGGYEDKLPKLTKVKAEVDDETSEEDGEED